MLVPEGIKDVKNWLEKTFGHARKTAKTDWPDVVKTWIDHYDKARNMEGLCVVAENELYKKDSGSRALGAAALNRMQKLAAGSKPSERGRLITEKIPVSKTGRERSCTVYLPPGYDNSKDRYPVVYLLHGIMPTLVNSPLGPPRNSDKYWKDGFKIGAMLDGLIASGAMKKAIVVMPSLGFRPEGDLPKKEDFIINDLVPRIDSEYRTLADKEHRAIDGYSSGAKLGLEIAINNPDKFSSVGGHNAYYFNAKKNVKGMRFLLTTTYWDPVSSAKSRRVARELSENGGEVVYDQHKMFTASQPSIHSYHMWKRGIGMSMIYHSMNFNRSEKKK